MVTKIMHDPLLPARKSVDATGEDEQIIQYGLTITME